MTCNLQEIMYRDSGMLEKNIFDGKKKSLTLITLQLSIQSYERQKEIK